MTSANAPALKSIAAKLRANYGHCSAGEKDRRQIKYRFTGKDKEHLRDRLREGGEWQCEEITTVSREREDTLYIERVMNLGKNRIEMRIPQSAWFPRDLCFLHS